MTKPIEWTTKRPAEVTQRRGLIVEVREEHDQPRPGGWHIVDQKRATPADLIAALAAMGDGERAEVLGAALPDERVARREWVDETRVIIRALPTESIQDAARRVVRERDEGREALRRAHELCADVTQKRIQEERERDEARTERGITADAFRAATDRADAAMRAERTACERAEKAERERDEAVALHKELADSLRSIHRSAIHERTVVAEEFDSLRTRLIAAETAAAQQPPRSYTLAEGSRWIENVIRSADGTQSWLSDGQVVTDGPLTGALRYTYRQPARDLAALLAKGGLL
jgi:hypothetical protein